MTCLSSQTKRTPITNNTRTVKTQPYVELEAYAEAADGNTTPTPPCNSEVLLILLLLLHVSSSIEHGHLWCCVKVMQLCNAIYTLQITINSSIELRALEYSIHMMG